MIVIHILWSLPAAGGWRANGLGGRTGGLADGRDGGRIRGLAGERADRRAGGRTSGSELMNQPTSRSVDGRTE